MPVMRPIPFAFDEIDRARRLLGLDQQASLEEVRSAYRRLCRQWHPDVQGGDARTSRKMQDINAAYRVLLTYCCQVYRFSFAREDVEQFDPERWWFRRFGQNVRAEAGKEEENEQ